jgi:hypothetical protein
MNESILKLLVIAAVLSVIIVPNAIFIYIRCCLAADEEADEENSAYGDQVREARRGSWGVEFFLCLPQTVV